MSDVFSAGDNLGDSSFLDTLSTPADNSTFGDLPLGMPSGFPVGGGSFADIFAGAVTPPQNLPVPANGGISGFLGDLTSLVSKVYAGDAQLTAAKSASDLARARAANQLQTVKTTPNVWLVLGIGAAGLFALEVMGRQK
jgi:hypothetical protein